MSQVSAPFGFRPVYGVNGQPRAQQYTIAGAYATAIYKGMMVTLNTNGTIVAAAAAADFLGVFQGVEYVDASGKPTYSNYWPAAQAIFTNSVPRAYVWSDPETVFEVQANGPVAQTAIGDQSDVVNVGSGSNQTGLSTSGLSSSLAGAGVQGQWKIVAIAPYADNIAGDPFTIVQVQMARSQFVANKVAI